LLFVTLTACQLLLSQTHIDSTLENSNVLISVPAKALYKANIKLVDYHRLLDQDFENKFVQALVFSDKLELQITQLEALHNTKDEKLLLLENRLAVIEPKYEKLRLQKGKGFIIGTVCFSVGLLTSILLIK